MARMLTRAQRDAYQRLGVVFPVPVLSDAQVQRFRTACDDLEARLGGKPRTVEVRQMHLHFRWAWELASHPRVLDAVEDVLGPDLLVWATELFAKHPEDSAVSIGWHRDQPYMGLDPQATTTAWIALSDSTSQNGCMCVVPDPDRDRSGRDNGRRLTPSDDQTTKVTLRAGEMSLHDACVLHGSAPNRSSQKRVGFAVRFVTPQAGLHADRPPAVLARGEAPGGQFQLLPPPDEDDAEQALEDMKHSAARHLETMLHRLKRRD
jgi:non-haem Fe2+, alpha-ketoglutarate-dependent halogenase